MSYRFADSLWAGSGRNSLLINATCFGQFLCPSSGVFHCTHNNGVCHTVCEKDQDGVPSWSCSQAVSKPVWHIPLLCVQWKTPDDGQRNCPKHVAFYSKNKFEKLVHLVGFIIRIYHDARSPERQTWCQLVSQFFIHLLIIAPTCFALSSWPSSRNSEFFRCGRNILGQQFKNWKHCATIWPEVLHMWHTYLHGKCTALYKYVFYVYLKTLALFENTQSRMMAC